MTEYMAQIPHLSKFGFISMHRLSAERKNIGFWLHGFDVFIVVCVCVCIIIIIIVVLIQTDNIVGKHINICRLDVGFLLNIK